MRRPWNLKVILWFIALAITLWCGYGPPKLGVYLAALIGVGFYYAVMFTITAYVVRRERRGEQESWGVGWDGAIAAAEEARRMEEEMSHRIAEDWGKHHGKNPPDKPL